MEPAGSTDLSNAESNRRQVSRELLPYVKLVEFLGVMLGKDAEVLLHDTSDLSQSIVAIANSHVSGRSVGGPATDLVLRIWQSRQFVDHDYLANYVSDSRSGRKMRSSTFFIRNDRGDVIGLLCINLDNGRLLEARNLIDQVLSVAPIEEAEEVSENLTLSLEDLMSTRIDAIIESTGSRADQISKDERIAFIEQLHEMGIFQIKGSVAKVADALAISEPTAYRYLNIVRKHPGARKHSTD